VKRSLLALTAAAAGLAGAAGPAPAQYTAPLSRPNYGPGYRPQLSPYLNLLRGGDPASNYFLGVIPEQQRRANTQLFRQEISALEVEAAQSRLAPQDADIFQPLHRTGHPTAFGNTVTYFGQTNSLSMPLRAPPRTPPAAQKSPARGTPR
jgi:hypothetical protein